jgi:hypothetical protein
MRGIKPQGKTWNDDLPMRQLLQKTRGLAPGWPGVVERSGGGMDSEQERIPID